ncbi:hypothetical protein P7K49_015276 [Saguinus oedipus]|uniref:Uncharacterized protein n=1 Tax=Saguinus oedipus TaxID=9490 RepID=A0ABQ9V950_SAGOE|nr:hypothetical protein P7K49_015276 [Saguinus oedipus]
MFYKMTLHEIICTVPERMVTGMQFADLPFRPQVTSFVLLVKQQNEIAQTIATYTGYTHPSLCKGSLQLHYVSPCDKSLVMLMPAFAGIRSLQDVLWEL